MWKGIVKRIGVAGAAVSAVAVLAGAALPAQAATSPWQQVFSHHYGSADDYSGFKATVAFGPNNVWEFGGSDLSGGGSVQVPIIVQWRGRGWTGNVAPSGIVVSSRDTNFIQAASGDSATDIWAVTFDGGYVLHYNGTRWSVAVKLPATSDSILTSIAAVSPRNVWVFGQASSGVAGGGTWHFDGTTWRHETTSALGANLAGASAVNGSNIWGVGSFSESSDEIEHFNGSNWTVVSDPVLTGLTSFGVHAFSATNIWGTAQTSISGGTGYLLHYGDHWSKVAIPWGNVARSDVTSDGKGGLWFMTAPSGNLTEDYAVHWFPGNKWQRFPLTGIDGAPVNIPGTSSVVVTGDSLTNTGSSAVVYAYGPI